jgi:hypothetical protein
MGATDSFAEFKATSGKKLTVLKNAFRSREGFKFFIETGDSALDQHGHPGSNATWSNEDLDPTPPEKRTWSLVRKLDSGFHDGGHRAELVAEHSCHLRQSVDLFDCYVLQLEMRECLSYRLSRRCAECLWHVG